MIKTEKKKICLITTGGTIFCEETKKGLSPTKDYLEKYDVLGILRKMSNFPKSIDITVNKLMNIDSADMSFNDISKIIFEVEKGEFDGYVVTHGTDTLDYSIRQCSMVYDMEFRKESNKDIPVVFTGSMNPFINKEGEVYSPAAENLCGAFNLVLEKQPDVMVFFSGRCIEGSKVTKVFNDKDDAFRNKDDVEYITIIPFMSATDFRKIVYTIKGDKPTVTIILSCYGTGTAPKRFLPAISDAANDGVEFAVSSQCVGNIDLEKYSSGRKLREAINGKYKSKK